MDKSENEYYYSWQKKLYQKNPSRNKLKVFYTREDSLHQNKKKNNKRIHKEIQKHCKCDKEHWFEKKPEDWKIQRHQNWRNV